VAEQRLRELDELVLDSLADEELDRVVNALRKVAEL
jgi:hypothetical protein